MIQRDTDRQTDKQTDRHTISNNVHASFLFSPDSFHFVIFPQIQSLMSTESEIHLHLILQRQCIAFQPDENIEFVVTQRHTYTRNIVHASFMNLVWIAIQLERWNSFAAQWEAECLNDNGVCVYLNLYLSVSVSMVHRFNVSWNQN